jgi:hypothetical protein
MSSETISDKPLPLFFSSTTNRYSRITSAVFLVE